MRRANDIAKRRKLEARSVKREDGPTQRSVTVEIGCNRFHHLTAVNAVPSSWQEEKRSCYSATARLYRVVNDKQPCCETYTIFQNMEMKYEHFSSSQEEYAAELWEVVKNPSRFKKHLKVVLETKETLKTDVISNPGYLAERSLSTERQMNCHLEEGTTERSVTLELSSNRFLAALEMTAGMKHGAGTELQRIGSESSATARFDRVAFNLANGRDILPVDNEKSSGDGSDHPVSTKNGSGTAQTARWTPETTRVRLKSFGEHEKLAGDGSTCPVSTILGPGTAQTTRGRGNPAWGVDQMRVSDKMETMQEAVISDPGYSGERSLSTEQQMNCHLEEGTTERSVTTEQNSNRFSAFGMTEKYDWNINRYPSPCRELPLQGKQVLTGAGANRIGHTVAVILSGVEGSVTPEQNSNRFLSSFGMTDMFEASATARFYRVVSDKPGIKMPHDTIVRQQRCKRDNNLNPFFLIEEHAMNCKQFSPPGEMPAGQRGAIVANKNKTSAYET